MISRLMTWGAVAVLLLGLASGCGGKGGLNKVSGVLTWEDGTPIDGATVVLMPKEGGNKSASGFTGKDGTFDLTTFKPGDGAQAGEYKVVVTRSEVKADTGGPGSGENDRPDPAKAMKEFAQKAKEGKKPDAKVTIPPVYTKEASTPLMTTIPVSGKLELKLKKV